MQEKVEEEEAEGGPPVPRNEAEAYLNEYYRNYYEQAFAKAAAEFEEQRQAYNAANAAAEAETAAGSKRAPPPDDGYVVPKPDFQEYVVTGEFRKGAGKMVQPGTGGSDHWDNKGLSRDSEGRHLDAFYDTKQFDRGVLFFLQMLFPPFDPCSAADAGIKVVKNAPDKKKAKKEKKVVPSWMAEDPLEGAFK